MSCLFWTVFELFNIVLLGVSATPVCVYNNQFYISDTEIYVGGCNVAYCDKMAQLVHLSGCTSKTGSFAPTTRIMPTTLPIMTTTLFGCNVGGTFYAPGSEISRHEARASNWCYGSYCDSSGQIIHWDNFNCFTTTTTVATTVPLSTILSQSGCYYNGRFYPPNTNLGAPDDRATKYCTKCDENGKLQHWYDYDCFRGDTTIPTPTSPNGNHIVG